MRKKSKLTFSILLLVVLSSLIQIYPGRNEIFGAYEFCLMACFTIQIRPDGTFTSRADGDLFNDERVHGTWFHIGEGKIRAISPGPEPAQVIESRVPERSEFQVKVVDPAGAAFQGVVVSATDGVSVQEFKTGRDGRVLIPRCTEFTVSSPGFEPMRYRPANPQSNDFSVTLDLETIRVDDVWLVLFNRLYFLDADGSVHWDTAHVKLSPEREREIFH